MKNDEPPSRHLTVVPKRGPPEIWTQELADQICALIIEGMSLRSICQRPDMPCIVTVVKWQRERPSFAAQYARAREDQADTFAQEIIEIADDKSTDWIQDPETGQWKPNHDHINRARLRVDSRKWVAAKLKPQTYGERVEQLLKGEIKTTTTNVNVNIDATALSPEAREALRSSVLAALSPPTTIDHEADEEDDDDDSVD